MKTALESIVVAFSMYSKLPMPRIDWNEKNMKYCMCYFPLIGLVIGALMTGWFALCNQFGWGLLLRTCVLIVIPVIITGGIHLDGLLDTSDALSSFKSMEEKLEILKDSHAGAFAIIVCVCYFIVSLGVFSEAVFSDLFLIGLGFVLSRAYSALALVTFKKARNSGLLKTFADAAANKHVATVMIGYVVVVSAALIVIDPLRGSVQAALALAVFFWYRSMSYRKFGGITGDLAGFFLQVCELIMAMGVVLL